LIVFFDAIKAAACFFLTPKRRKV